MVDEVPLLITDTAPVPPDQVNVVFLLGPVPVTVAWRFCGPPAGVKFIGAVALALYRTLSLTVAVIVPAAVGV